MALAEDRPDQLAGTPVRVSPEETAGGTPLRDGGNGQSASATDAGGWSSRATARRTGRAPCDGGEQDHPPADGRPPPTQARRRKPRTSHGEGTMCLVHSILQQGVSRRDFLGFGLAAGLTAATADWGASLLLPGLAEGAETPPPNGGRGSSGVSLKWLGVDGWEIAFGRKTVLLDPWLSRTPGGLFFGPFTPKIFFSTPSPHKRRLTTMHSKKANLTRLVHPTSDITPTFP